MRFDPARVLDLADHRAETPSDPCFEARVGDALRASGWSVAAVPVAEGRLGWLIGLALFLLPLGRVVWLYGPAIGPRAADAGLEVVVLVAMAVVGLFLLLPRLGTLLDQRSGTAFAPPCHRVATRSDPSGNPRPARLIVLATEPVTGPHAWRWRLVLVFLVAIVGTGFRHPEWWKSESARALALVGALPLGVIALVTLRRLRHAEAIRPAPTGPAMLPELARSLPRSVVDRIDVWLVWTPSKSNIARQLRDPLRDGPPTLLIDLDTPGCGSLIVAGTGVAAEQAADVATSLHIPYRRRWRGGASLGGFARQGIPCVTLAGRPDQPPDPALLRAVAHLIAELALRRARSATAA